VIVLADPLVSCTTCLSSADTCGVDEGVKQCALKVCGPVTPLVHPLQVHIPFHTPNLEIINPAELAFSYHEDVDDGLTGEVVSVKEGGREFVLLYHSPVTPKLLPLYMPWNLSLHASGGGLPGGAHRRCGGARGSGSRC
jgi:hypothetical protein